MDNNNATAPTQVPAESAPPDARRLNRLQLLMSLGLFQIKLLADGGRDLLLVPVALACGLLGIFFGGDQPDRYFNRLLAFGRRSDRFINLFNQHDVHQSGSDGEQMPTSDQLLAPYREKLVNQAHNSPIATKANQLVDQIAEHPELTKREPRQPSKP